MKLNVINSSVTAEICGNKCGSKCCRMVGSSFKVPVTMRDYKQLKAANSAHLINWEGMFPHLKSDKENRCLALGEDNLCMIYSNRPLSCDKFPFRYSEDIPEFCILYHSSTESYRSRENKLNPSNQDSIGDTLFDLDEKDQIYQEYMYRLNNS